MYKFYLKSNNFISAILFFALLFVSLPAVAFAQSDVPSPVFCGGSTNNVCPTATPTAGQPITAIPTSPATSPVPTSNNTTPAPTLDPCESVVSVQHGKGKKKGHQKKKQGAVRSVTNAILELLINLLNMIIKLLGGQPITLPTNPGTPQPTSGPQPTVQPQPTIDPNNPNPQPTEDMGPTEEPGQPEPTSNPCAPTQNPAPTSSTSPNPTIQPTQGNSPTTCSGQNITPSTNIQTAVSSAPEGTTFCFAPGIYSNASISPKNGQIFDGGNRAAILDGKNSTQFAFKSSATNVTVRGFTIQNYNTPSQQGTIHARSSGWTISNNHITKNASTGVATGSNVKVLNNLIDWNKQQGYSAHGENILYEGNEIAFNNHDLSVDATWEAGGGKAWETKNATFRNNNSHDNGGNGLWDDTNNIYITYEGNTVTNNWGAGIYHEIGYDAKIINNTVSNNGMPSSPGGGQKLGWLWDAGIQIRASGALTAASPILISGNTVTNNYNGIALLDSPASGCTNAGLNEGAYGPCRIQNILVQNNTITMSMGATGAVQDGAGNAIFTSRNVKWVGNTYKVSSMTHPNDGHMSGWFAWMNTHPSWSQWQGYGNDTNGSFGQ